jgi:hypothetical protein
VPIALMIIVWWSGPMVPMYIGWLTWRGIYIIPLYITGALGVESVVRRVNGSESSWRSPSRLAFAATFVAYVFLAHLSFSLRALELLMMTGIA